MDSQGFFAQLKLSKALQEVMLWSLDASPGKIGLEYGLSKCLRFVLEKLDNLQILRMDNTFFPIPFQTRIDGRLAPLPCFASLKKLSILLPRDNSVTNALSASNVVWLLSVCSNLQQASLGCSINYQDFKYLSELHSTFAGLSNVKELALEVAYTEKSSDRNTWWGLENRRWKGGSKKTEALIHLLQVTKHLRDLEICCKRVGGNPEDKSDLYTSFCLGLHKSFATLRRLRLLSVRADPNNVKSTDYSRFKNLNLLAAEEYSLKSFLNLEIKLPLSLERLSLPFYICGGPAWYEFEELLIMSRLLDLRSIPRLKEVIVPHLPIRSEGEAVDYNRYQKVWMKKSKKLEDHQIFQSGKVKLRTMKVEEAGE